MSIPGGGDGPGLEYGVGFDLSGLQSASRQIEQWAKQLNERLKRDLSSEARIDIRNAEQAFQRLKALQDQYSQNAQQSFANSAKGLDTAYQTSGQSAQRVAQQVTQSFTQSANASAKAWTDSHSKAFDAIEQQQKRANERVRQNLINAGSPSQISQQIQRQAGGGDGEETQLHHLAAGAVRGITRGFGGGAGVPIGIGLTATAAAAIVVANAFEGITRAVNNAVVAGFRYNASLEQSQLIFRQLTGDVTTASAAIEGLRKYADITPFNTDEVIKSGQAFLRVTQGNTEQMLEFVKAAGALATTNPEQGLQGATYAIRELLGGDVQSIADRFNISRRAIRAMMDEGLSGIQLIQRINQELGVSSKTVEELSRTFAGRLSNITSFIENIGQAFTFPTFAEMSAELGVISDHVTTNQKAWMELAGTIGVVANAIGNAIQQALLAIPAFSNAATMFDKVKTFVEIRQKQIDANRPPDQVAADTRQTEVKAQIESVTQEITKQGGLIGSTQAKIAANTAAMSQLRVAAADVSREYEGQISSLERQLEVLNRPNIEREKQIAGFSIQQGQLDLAKLSARPPVQVEAAAAARQVQLDVASRLASIEARRIEIAQDYANAQERGKSALESQADALDKVVKTTQREVQAANEVRQTRIQGLREEQQLAQQVRSDRLDGLREEVRAAQQSRNDSLDTLREQIRDAQSLRSESRQTASDMQDAFDDAYNSIERASDRAHSRQIQNFEDQIDKLREQQDALDRSLRAPSQAEKELEALDKAERERDRQQALQDARRAVATARTPQARADANQRLTELRHDQGVDAKREQLQNKIKQEEEQAEQRKIAIEDKIQAIQKQSREADRNYQEQKEQKEIAREAELSQRRATERVQEAADRAQKKIEDEQLRQAEIADKIATRQEQERIRQEEQANRELERKEKAEIAAQEKTDREEDKADRQRILEAQTAAEQAREAATAEREAREEARARAADERKALVNQIELERLNIEENLLRSQDTAALAQAAAAQVYLDRTRERVTAEGQIEEGLKRQLSLDITGKITKAKDEEYERLRFIREQTKEIEYQGLLLKAQLDEQQRRLAELKESHKDLQNEANRLQKEKLEAGTPAATGAAGGPIPINNVKDIIDNAGAIGADIRKAIESAFSNDPSTVQAITGWVNTDIIGTVKAALGIASASTVFVQIGLDCIQGFVDGIGQAINAPVEAFNALYASLIENAAVGIGSFVETVVTTIATLPERIVAGGQAIIDGIWMPFQTIIDTYLPTLGEFFSQSGINAVTSWINGWMTQNPVQAVSETFNELSSGFFRGLNEFFNQSGENAGISWINGWVSAWNENWGNVQSAINSSIRNVQQTVSNATGGAVGLGMDTSQRQAEAAPATNSFDYLTPEQRSRLYDRVVSRHSGGSLMPGHMYRIQEGEYIDMFSNAGSMRTPNSVNRMLGEVSSSGAGSGGGVTVTIANGAVQMAVTAGNQQQLDEFGQQLMKTMVKAVTDAQRYAPNPAKNTLGGA